MSAADCREGRCSCAAIASRPDADLVRTVTQRAQFGCRDDDGGYDWADTFAHLVTPTWAKHIAARLTAPGTLIEHTGDWLIYRTHPHLAEVADTAVARIRWERPHGCTVTPGLLMDAGARALIDRTRTADE